MKVGNVSFASLTDLVRERAQTQADERSYTFLVDGETQEMHITFRELQRRVLAIAVRLQECGASGSRALLLYPPGIEYICGFLGCLAAGVIAVPIYPPDPGRLARTLPRLISVIADSEATIVLTTTPVFEMAELLFAAAPVLRNLQWIATDAVDAIAENAAATAWKDPGANPETIAFLQYTSGSTGSPKGVILTHGNVLHNLSLISHCFGISRTSRGVIWLPPYHDMGLIGGILQPLYLGCYNVLLSPIDFLKRPMRWLSAISRYRATTSGGPNFAYDLCVRKSTPEERATLDLSSWNLAFNGAEPIHSGTLQRFVEAFAPSGFRLESFYPCYGLAEATLIATGGIKGSRPTMRSLDAEALRHNQVAIVATEHSRAHVLVSAGRELPNHALRIVDPESRIPCAERAIGEIWLAGPSVACGYWGRPEETAIAFHGELAGENSGNRWLRTGDLGFLDAGELFVTGRRKDLIIIRGRNHYPQDIERTAEQCHKVLRPGCGAVFSIEMEDEERLVVVHEVDRGAVDTNLANVAQAIRSAIAKEHEVQAHTIVLVGAGRIPKTSSGKIQRRECRAAFSSGEIEPLYISAPDKLALAPVADAQHHTEGAPSNRLQLETYLKETIANILRIRQETLNAETSLHSLGLDSMGAIELAAILELSLEIQVSLTELLKGPTIGQLADLVSSARKTTRTSQSSEQIDNGDAPLSAGQQALWFLHQLAPSSAAYHVPVAVRICAALDISALERAFLMLVARHPALRTTFSATPDGPVQRVSSDAFLDFKAIEAQDLSSADFDARLAIEAHRPFDIENGPLIRVRVFTRAPNDYAVLIFMHHIITDFWSLAVMAKEIDVLYPAAVVGARIEVPLPTYSTLNHAQAEAAMLQGPRGADHAAYWKAQLAGNLPILDLPTDRRRPPVQTYSGRVFTTQLNAQLTIALKVLARELGATLNMLLQSAFQALLHRYTGQDDFTLGVVSAVRDRPELASVVGYFVNPLVIRTRPSALQSFTSFVSDTRTTLFEAFEHQAYPFSTLVDLVKPPRDESRSPLFQVLFVYQRAHGFGERDLTPFGLGISGARSELAGLPIESITLNLGVSQFDLSLTMGEAMGELVASFEYNTDLFDAATIERMAVHFESLLRGIVASPTSTLAELPMLSEREQRQLFIEWQGATVEIARGDDIVSRFDKQAIRTPNATAVLFQDKHLAYHELQRNALDWATLLRARGAESGTRIGICLERSIELVTAVFGVLYAGCVYVPLDPNYPTERIAFMLSDADVLLTVTSSGLRGVIDRAAGAAPVLCVDELPTFEKTTIPRPQVNSSDLACLIYTSGSTGNPKAVMLEHGGIANLVSSFVDAYQPNAQDRILPLTSIASASFVGELLPLLCVGGAVVLPNDNEVLDIDRLLARIASSGVTIISTVPAVLAALRTSIASRPPLRLVLCGGERLMPSDIEGLTSHTMVVNGYGLTETTVCSTFFRASAANPDTEDEVPIGRPIVNTEVHVLDDRLNALPVGCAGELYIGGAGLARGYWRRPDLTAQRFVAHPFRHGERLYRTGDRARRRPDGELAFLHREDEQVKIRGHRVELGEVTAAVKRLGGVRDAIVVLREDKPGESRLVAYLVVTGTARTNSDLRASLAVTLPAHALPAAFVAIDSLPLTPNGKIDVQALPAPEGERPALAAVYSPPQSEIERQIALIWKRILGIDNVGIHDNFFDLGGNSMLIARTHRALRDELKAELSLVDMFKHSTISALAGHIGGATASRAQKNPPIRVEPQTRQTAIAVVGLAGRFPGARTAEKLWENLRDGVESITFFTEDELIAAGVDPALARAPDYVKARGILGDTDLFDPSFFGLNPREAALMDPQHRIFLECAWEALENAGYSVDAQPGRTGVFAGMSMNTYLLANVYGHIAHVASVESLQAAIGNDKDALTTEVAYRLNLKGPAVTIQSSSSTSLVAIHYACQSLLNLECDMALAGGVSIHFPEKAGYMYDEGGTTSADGHCRTFDEKATGFVAGHGAGVVVLRRLTDAIAAGDTIYAVVKGSAVNNDGSLKVSYMAPSVEGQAEVVELAQATAGVSPDDIGYVEAHGTATPIGDPIELAALVQAFRRGTNRVGYCAIGSIKTNIGHLDAAAGVAGFIKATLALHHAKIPPSLHFERPNPAFDLDRSPFYVNTQLTDWPDNGKLRRAGVTSLGMGGTNAHVVLEQAPPIAAKNSTNQPELLVLSARSDNSLEIATDQLVGHFEKHSELSLADIACTLQMGRKAFGRRRAIVCDDLVDAARVLASRDPARLIDGNAARFRPPVVFLFPGQGTQHIDMGRGLYEAEKVFRAEVDGCAELLMGPLGMDVRTILYPAPDKREMAAEQLAMTSFTQPALFVIEYALAKLWMSWGITPKALLGHSVGEYVAACLAGVFRLEDALSLVVARGRHMQSTEPGAMLAVPLSEAELESLLDPTLSLAAVNAPRSSVVAGETHTIELLATQLAEQGITSARLRTSHAFHSTLMDPILDAFRANVAMFELHPPRLAFLSNVTGTWITPEQAQSPDYWTRHLRTTVRFADGMGKLLEDEDAIVFEIGPGQTLTQLARQHPARRPMHVFLSSLGHAKVNLSDKEAILRALGRAWTAGVEPDWSNVCNGERRRRVPLPTQPFERQRHWIEPKSPFVDRDKVEAPTQKQSVDKWFYLPSWRRTPAPPVQTAIQRGTCWLFIADPPDKLGLGARLEQKLRETYENVIVIRPGNTFREMEDNSFSVRPAAADDYHALVRQLFAKGNAPSTVIHLWTALGNNDPDRNVVTFESMQNVGFSSVLMLTQSLVTIGLSGNINLIIVSHSVHSLGEESPCMEASTLVGLCRVIPQEHPTFACKLVDIMAPLAGSIQEDALAQRLVAECNVVERTELLVAYRGLQRSVRVFEPMTLRDSPNNILRDRGVYLLLGGLGQLGINHAKALASRCRARLILVGRSVLPERAIWDVYLAEHAAVDPVCRKIQSVREIESLGGEVLVLSADVTDANEISNVIDRGIAHFGALHGIVFAAGTVDASLFRTITELRSDDVYHVFGARVRGLYALKEALGSRALDFCMIDSSLAAALGGIGRAAYAAATSFMEGFAVWQSQTSLVPWTSVSWDAFAVDGATNSSFVSKDPFGPLAITDNDGADAFFRLLGLSGTSNIVVSTTPLAPRLIYAPERLESINNSPQLNANQPDDSGHERAPRGAMQNAYVAPRTDIEAKLAEIWGITLGIAEVGVFDSFFDLGGNSLVGVKMIARINDQFHANLPAVSLYESPTIEALARLLDVGNASDDDENDDQGTSRGARRRARQKRRIRGGDE